MTSAEIDWQQILKWVLVVLAAGFIGQFGKRLADFLLARRRKKGEAREQATTDPQEADPSSLSLQTTPAADAPGAANVTDAAEVADAKTAKKLAKAAAKAAKKAAKRD